MCAGPRALLAVCPFICPQGISSGRAVLATAHGCFPGGGDPGVGTAVGGGLRVYQEHDDRVRLGNHLSPTLHPEVGTGMAAAHVEGKVGFPGGATWGARPSTWPRGGDWAVCTCSCQAWPFPSSSLRFLRAVSAVACGGHTENCQIREHICGSGDVNYVQNLGHMGRKGAWRRDPELQVSAQVRAPDSHLHWAFPIPVKPNRLCFPLGQRGLFYLLKMFVVFSSLFFHSISALNLAPYRGDKLT